MKIKLRFPLLSNKLNFNIKLILQRTKKLMKKKEMMENKMNKRMRDKIWDKKKREKSKKMKN